MLLKSTQYQYDNVHALVVVTAREHGQIYELKNGTLATLDYVAEHPNPLSDNEGFFFRSSGGNHLGSGQVREADEEHQLEQYVRAMANELSDYLAAITPELVLVFEPKYLRGMVAESVKNPNHIPFVTIKHGNFVAHPKTEINTLVKDAFTSETDPADPESVSDDEENAAEKRRILEIGQKVQR